MCFLQTVTAGDVTSEYNTIYSKNYHNMDCETSYPDSKLLTNKRTGISKT